MAGDGQFVGSRGRVMGYDPAWDGGGFQKLDPEMYPKQVCEGWVSGLE